MEKILSIHGISKKYGRIQAVNGLFIEIYKGQVFGLLGPNGSGKTTTLSILLDLVRNDSGTFEWFGKPPSKESRKRIGSVIENPNFFPYLTAVKNLQIVADIKDKPYDDLDEVLQLTGLYDRRNDRFRTYSFGMKQRLAVASALLGNPDVLILDEPTNGLDPQGIAKMRELIKRVAEKGITIILASHLLDEVQKICSHVAVLSKGKKLFDGEVSDVLAISELLEIAADDMIQLEKAISMHPGFSSLVRSEDRWLVYFKGKIVPAEVNEFLHRQGIVLTHLSERKRTLEQHFLELLRDNS
ncbi:MAG: ATP-binding cassette domain-containing protein [Bacteroidetes bacterium]|nr:ATP-binding cassette domain-containing protein [Bacteroidota bacterium]